MPKDRQNIVLGNMPQISCATYAIKHLGLPVIFQYEDDIFVSVSGEAEEGWLSKCYRSVYKRNGPNKVGRPK
jgi:hypothetical protein